MYDQEGRQDALNYEKMVIYLAEIAKDQKAQIENQQKQINDLKDMVTALANSGKEKPQQ